MNRLLKACYIAAVMITAGTGISCSDDNNTFEEHLTPSQILSSTPWETTAARDKDGNPVDLNDAKVNGFVGFAYFKTDGNFAIYGLNDVLRSRGTWSVDPIGKTRTITALRADGATVFSRDVDILVLNKNEFTYRIHTNASDPSEFYDIVHTRVVHPEPHLGQLILASHAWETKDALDNQGNHVDLNNAAVNGFVGYGYFNPGGAYRIYGLNNVLRSQGRWLVSLDGKTRTIIALDDNGNELFTRNVDILVLDDTTFTYRIHPNQAYPSIYYDIVHKSVNHPQP
ncbi:protein of unknown function [Chryseobacterium sp. RU37D]|uniref:DUF4822 domain-containing protein n=1 Tax=Chryseobacterium sp. RU37D TaxID=1907397 RepID=UPI00095521DD|nr:DUF4822 domain-containing protein [Chryseobacterium sp. RU37D]SIQ42262.1 protein of unknown function [Chryseobacterium sp. RU37D]